MKYSIIGAGVGGLTTVLAFEKAGIAYQVFEKNSKHNHWEPVFGVPLMLCKF